MLVLVAAVAGLFFVKAPDGNPILSASGITQKVSQGVKSLRRRWHDTGIAARRKSGDENAGKTQVYKWQDNQGQWHYSDEAPADKDAQLLQVDPNVNRMDAAPLDKAPDRTLRRTSGAPSAVAPLLQARPTPGRIDKAIQETRDVTPR